MLPTTQSLRKTQIAPRKCNGFVHGFVLGFVLSIVLGFIHGFVHGFSHYRVCQVIMRKGKKEREWEDWVLRWDVAWKNHFGVYQGMSFAGSPYIFWLEVIASPFYLL